MNKKIFTGLVVLMGISILGIITVQLVWMNNAIRVKNELFSRSVNDALNNTVSKLEELHNLGVVNQLIFNDSLHWASSPDIDYEVQTTVKRLDSIHEIMPPGKAPRPVHIIREINPKKGKTRIEFKINSDSKKPTQTFAYQYSSTAKSSSRPIIIDDTDKDSNEIFFIQSDTIISDIDSLYTVGMVKIDSLLTHLDTLAVARPDFSKRVELKAGKLKMAANKIVAEVESWDVTQINKDHIKKVLDEELKNKNIPIDFQLAVINDSLIDLGPDVTDSVKLVNTEYKVDLYPNDIFQKNIKLAVIFPNRENFIYHSLNWLLVASFLFSIIILVTFALSIFYILRQKKISEMKSDFINNMTHEFKTPIATISVATDSITNEKVVKDPERIRYFAGMIKKENTRMNRQVEDILTIARLDRKDFEFVWEAVNVHELIDDAIQGIMIQVEKRGGSIDTKLDAANPVITTDKNHCTNVIYNLLDNAIKYSTDAPKINVITSSKPKGILISVMDNGIGMSKNVQGKIFERFYRQTSGNVHNVKGFGLGLSYVKAVIEANHGTISVQSEPGKGSKFDVFLPFVRE